MENKQTTQNGTAGAVRTARARALDVAYVGMAAAVLAVCSWISVPMPKPLVSFTMQTFAVALIAGLLGVRHGGIAYLLWAPMEGFLFRLGKGKLPLLILGMAAGLALCYTFGTAWFMVVYARTTGPVALSTVLGWCVLPYLVPDAVKLAMAVPLILKGRKHLRS